MGSDAASLTDGLPERGHIDRAAVASVGAEIDVPPSPFTSSKFTAVSSVHGRHLSQVFDFGYKAISCGGHASCQAWRAHAA